MARRSPARERPARRSRGSSLRRSWSTSIATCRARWRPSRPQSAWPALAPTIGRPLPLIEADLARRRRRLERRLAAAPARTARRPAWTRAARADWPDAHAPRAWLADRSRIGTPARPILHDERRRGRRKQQVEAPSARPRRRAAARARARRAPPGTCRPRPWRRRVRLRGTAGYRRSAGPARRVRLTSRPPRAPPVRPRSRRG